MIVVFGSINLDLVTRDVEQAERRVERDGDGDAFPLAGLGVELSATDDAVFHDRMHRARDRGLFHFEQITHNLVELIAATDTSPTLVDALETFLTTTLGKGGLPADTVDGLAVVASSCALADAAAQGSCCNATRR